MSKVFTTATGSEAVNYRGEKVFEDDFLANRTSIRVSLSLDTTNRVRLADRPQVVWAMASASALSSKGLMNLNYYAYQSCVQVAVVGAEYSEGASSSDSVGDSELVAMSEEICGVQGEKVEVQWRTGRAVSVGREYFRLKFIFKGVAPKLYGFRVEMID